MTKLTQKKVCLDCGKSFVGNPRARYCPGCRELRRTRNSHEGAEKSNPGPVRRSGSSRMESLKKYISFSRLAILNIIFLVVGLSYAWYLNSQPFSMETQQKLEAFAPTNMALITLLVLGSGVRFFYGYKDKKTGNPFWRENYWKQLVMWLCGLAFTECMALYFVFS